MKVLVVKLTSMGDAIHVLPALSDLQAHHPDVAVDWMIEESFAEIPAWHPSVSKVIPVATRRWRAFNMKSLRQFIAFWKELRKTRYDVIIDAQGLIKSAVFARFAKVNPGGRRIGFSADSIKERPAARFYKEKISVARDQHAIARLRTLFAKSFNYQSIEQNLDYRLNERIPEQEKTLMFLHGTTWMSKHLPEQHWHELLDLAVSNGYQVLLPWGNQIEKERAERIAKDNTNAKVLQRSSLNELLQLMRTVSASISVDTGLGHLAAALGVPTVSIYGSTNSSLTGAIGENQVHFQTDYSCSPCLLKHCDKLTGSDRMPPCYRQASPTQIWSLLMKLLN